MRQVMSFEHPRWEEFYDILENAIMEYDPKEDDWYYRCAGGGDLNCTFEAYNGTITILKGWGNFDLLKTIHWLQDHGGYCDCEVLMNCDKNETAKEDII